MKEGCKVNFDSRFAKFTCKDFNLRFKFYKLFASAELDKIEKL